MKVVRSREDLSRILTARDAGAFDLEIVTDRGVAVLRVPALSGGGDDDMARRPVKDGQLAANGAAGGLQTVGQPAQAPPPQSFLGVPPQAQTAMPAQATLPQGTAPTQPSPAGVVGHGVIDVTAKWGFIKRAAEQGIIKIDNPHEPLESQWGRLLQAAPQGWFGVIGDAVAPPPQAPPTPPQGAPAWPVTTALPAPQGGAPAWPTTPPQGVPPAQPAAAGWPPAQITHGMDFTGGAPSGVTQMFAGAGMANPGAPTLQIADVSVGANRLAPAGLPAQSFDFSQGFTAPLAPPQSPAHAPAAVQAPHAPPGLQTPPTPPQGAPPRDLVTEVANGSGIVAYVERLMQIDVARTADYVRGSLRLGEGRTDKRIVAQALDEANGVTEQALLLVLKAREDLKRIESEITAGRAGMREQAHKALAADKEAGNLAKKTISNEDTNAKMSELFHDEYEAQAARLRAAKSAVEFFEDLHSRSKSKNVDIRSIYDHFNPG